MAKSNSMKIKVALLFGGKSAEHDISVISALQAYRHLNKDKYDVYPIYITKDGEMFFGEDTGKIEAYSDIDTNLRADFCHLVVNESIRKFDGGDSFHFRSFAINNFHNLLLIK